MLTFAFCLFSSIVYASFPQSIQYCFGVHGNTSPFQFASGFSSSDVFDGLTLTKMISNGRECITHTYKKGPKKIKFYLKFNGYSFRDINIKIANTCYPFMLVKRRWKTTNFVNTAHRNETWDFDFVQLPPENAYRYSYQLLCTRISNA